MAKRTHQWKNLSIEAHNENLIQFENLIQQRAEIPDELYYWFNTIPSSEVGETGSFLSDARYTNLYTYLINHNQLASRQADDDIRASSDM